MGRQRSRRPHRGKRERRQIEPGESAERGLAVQLDHAPLAHAVEEGKVDAMGGQRRDGEQAGEQEEAMAAEDERLGRRGDDRQTERGRAAVKRDPAGYALMVGRQHEHRQQPVADADRGQGEPAAEARRRMDRNARAAQVEQEGRGDAPGQRQREQRPEGGGGRERRQPDRDEARRQRQRPRVPQGGAQNEGGECEAGRQQQPGQRKQESGRAAARRQMEKAAQQAGKAAEQRRQRRQDEVFMQKRLRHQHRHELE
jgi:hypothetical protein